MPRWQTSAWRQLNRSISLQSDRRSARAAGNGYSFKVFTSLTAKGKRQDSTGTRLVRAFEAVVPPLLEGRPLSLETVLQGAMILVPDFTLRMETHWNRARTASETLVVSVLDQTSSPSWQVLLNGVEAGLEQIVKPGDEIALYSRAAQLS